MAEVTPAKDEAVADSHEEAEERKRWNLHQYLAVAVVVLGITLPAFFLRPIVGSRSIALLYLLGVVLTSLFVDRGPALLAAAMSALFWDFFFLEPIAKLRIDNVEDIFMFGMYFVVALVLGQLTSRIRAQEKLQNLGQRRSTALYRLTGKLAQATNLEQMLESVVHETEAAFDAQIAILLTDSAGELSYHAHPASTYDITGPEQPVADWVFEHGQQAGRSTDNLAHADTLFVPLAASDRALGVMGLRFREPSPPTLEQRRLLETFCHHIALALDRHRLAVESEKAKLLAESERLSKTLLNSMSHEIRTPLAVIKSATDALVELHCGGLSKEQQAMIAEIHEATERLNGLVGKVLDITRLESGSFQPNLTLCDVQDVIHVSVKDTKKQLARHKLSVELAPELPLIRADFVLLHQALTNLLSNAAFHTSPGTAIQIGARVMGGALVITVADRGPGIPPASIARVFDKFYRAPTAPTGGTGLGLSLVKGFVEAHGGQVTAENREGGGALFSIRLPLSQTELECVEANS